MHHHAYEAPDKTGHLDPTIMSGKHSNFGFADFLLTSEEDTTVYGRSATAIARFDEALDEWIEAGKDRPAERRAEAAAKITSARDHNLTRLDLSRLALSSLPECISTLDQLEWLVLVSNQLTELPAWVTRMPFLVGLYVSCNKLTQLPANIGDLSRLERLRIDHNSLEKLPDSIGQLRALKQLSFGANRIEALPEVVWFLPELDDETVSTLPRIEQENRIAYLEYKARNIDQLLYENHEVAKDVSILSAAAPDSPTSPPTAHQGLMGLLALQRVQLGSRARALHSEIESMRIDIAVQDAELG